VGGPGGEWRIRDGSGDDLIRAGGGSDEISLRQGRDTVYGGRGRDSIVYSAWGRGFKRDRPDRLFGGPGPDQISDFNRRSDLIRCGPGTDLAWWEPRDRFRRDCERVGRRPRGSR